MSGDFASAADALSAALLHSVWQGVVAAAVFFAVRRFGRLGAKGRHDLGCSLLALLPVAAVATFTRKMASGAGDLPDIAGNQGDAAPLPGLATVALTPTVLQGDAWAWPSWANAMIAVVWLLGSSLLLLRSALGLWATRRLSAHSARPLPEELRFETSRIVREMGLPVATRVVACVGALVPYTYGWLAPVVVMPMTAIAGLDATHVRMLLRHELVHVLRKDFVFNALQGVAESLLFYHPLVWWLSAQIRVERETACDAAVVALGVDRVGYARALAALENLRHEVPEPALGAQGGDLKMRIRAILKASPRPAGATWSYVAVAAGLALAGVVVSCSVDALGPENAAEAVVTESGPSALTIAWLPPNVARYRSEVESAARAHSVDPNLIALVVLVESGGDPLARSPVGSLGLMQLMPATARGVAERAGIASPADEALFDVATNLDLGVRLLAELSRVFVDGDAAERRHHTLAAYNAGTKAVRAQLQSGASLPDETVRYVALLEALYRESGDMASPAYQAWRERVMERVTTSAVAPVEAGRVSSAFGPRVDPIEHADSFHEGVDIAERVGTSVRAPLAGVVSEAGDSGDARGLFVVVRHAGQLETRYYHLAKVTVEAGRAIAAGEAIGLVGNTGRSTGPHVHLELRDQGRPVDPRRVLGGQR